MQVSSKDVESRSYKSWSILDVIVVFFLGLFLGVLAAVIGLLVAELFLNSKLSGTTEFVLLTFLLYLGFALSVWLWMIKLRRVSPRELGFNAVSIRSLYLMFPILLFMWFVNIIVASATSAFIGPYDNPQTKEIARVISSPADLIGVIFVIAIVAPVVEETVFRGVLYRYLRPRLGVFLSIIITSFIFAIVHFIPVILPLLFVAGCFLAWVSERYNSLYPSMFLHFLNNFTMVILIYITMRG